MPLNRRGSILVSISESSGLIINAFSRTRILIQRSGLQLFFQQEITMCHGMILRFTKQSAEQTRKDGDLPI